MRLVLVASLLCASTAFARVDDKDVDIARQHYRHGRDLYETDLYAEAVKEFEAAHTLAPSPLLDYNIALCHDRLEEWQLAVDAYERYLASTPKAPDVSEVRARINVLQHRLREGTAVPKVDLRVNLPAGKTATKSTSKWPWLVGASALAVTAAGVGLLGHVGASYRDLGGSCAPACAPEAWARLPGEQAAGYALLVVGVAGASVDLGLWLWRKRASIVVQQQEE